jgi:hypothetical protein
MAAKKGPTPKLTAKQQAFVNHYLICLNATEAARLAGYAGGYSSHSVIGSNNLRNIKISAEIDARLKEHHLTADEALARLASHARGDMGDCIEITEGGLWRLDLNKMKELGLTHLIKKLSWNEYGPVIELHDVQSAIAQILKYIQPNTEINLNINISDARERIAQRLNSLATRGNAPTTDRVTH